MKRSQFRYSKNRIYFLSQNRSAWQELLLLVTHSLWHLLIKAGLAQVTDRHVQ